MKKLPINICQKENILVLYQYDFNFGVMGILGPDLLESLIKAIHKRVKYMSGKGKEL